MFCGFFFLIREVYTSPLHVAARHGRAEAARLLLDLGAEKDYSSNMQDRSWLC